MGTGGSCSVESSKGSCLKVSDIHILERSQISVNRFTAKDGQNYTLLEQKGVISSIIDKIIKLRKT